MTSGVWISERRSRGDREIGWHCFRCSLSGSDADRWLEVPAWMFDRSVCAKVRVADAHFEAAWSEHAGALPALLRTRPMLSGFHAVGGVAGAVERGPSLTLLALLLHTLAVDLFRTCQDSPQEPELLSNNFIVSTTSSSNG
jgi:hypothetical protein